MENMGHWKNLFNLPKVWHLPIFLPRRKLRIRRLGTRRGLQPWLHLDNCLWPGSHFLLIVKKDFIQSCICSPTGSPICSPCAPTCVTGVKSSLLLLKRVSRDNINSFSEFGPAAGSPCVFPFKWAGVIHILLDGTKYFTKQTNIAYKP